MFNWLKRLADCRLSRWTLIVGNGNTQCGRCHFWANPLEPCHLTVPGHADVFPGKQGCGATWRFVTKRYLAGLPWPAPGEPDPLELINRDRKRLGRRQLIRLDVMPAPSPGYYVPPRLAAWKHRLYSWRRQLLSHLRVMH